MLIEFSVSNFLSFKEKVTLSMVATGIKESPGSLIAINENLSLLKSTVLYGANASGKSNLFHALGFMRMLVISSVKNNPDDNIEVERFAFSSECDNKPSLFEAVFLVEGVKYVYGFSVDTEKIHEEWLHSYDIGKKRELFKRSNGKIVPNSKYFSEGKNLDKKTRPNSLFLSVVSQFNGEISGKILRWFRNLIGIPIEYQPDHNFLDNDKLKPRIMEFITIADLQIMDIKKEKININDPRMKNAPKEWIEILQKGEGFTLQASHSRYDKNHKLLGLADINFGKESAGTQKMVALAGRLIEALSKGKIVIIDELDSSLHPLITHKIIEFFNGVDNKKNAQLIFTTHDTNLLGKKLFRRDQIWFTEKDRYGSSDLYSLVDFKVTKDNSKVRMDASFQKDYLMGKYGAIPFIGDSSHLLDDGQGK
jgi:hypothetical protein